MLKNKWFVTALCVVGASVLTGGGYYGWVSRPVGMPQSPEEAVAMINSSRFNHLPDYRQEEYLERTRRLIRDADLSREDRRGLYRAIGDNEQAREAMGRLFQQQFMERTVALANMTPEEREAAMQEQWEQRRQNRPERRDREDRPEPTDQERQERRDRMKNHIQDRMQNGNPQTGGIMGEYWRHRREHRIGR